MPPLTPIVMDIQFVCYSTAALGLGNAALGCRSASLGFSSAALELQYCRGCVQDAQSVLTIARWGGHACEGVEFARGYLLLGEEIVGWL